jgi:hypothetical protein
MRLGNLTQSFGHFAVLRKLVELRVVFGPMPTKKFLGSMITTGYANIERGKYKQQVYS